MCCRSSGPDKADQTTRPGTERSRLGALDPAPGTITHTHMRLSERPPPPPPPETSGAGLTWSRGGRPGDHDPWYRRPCCGRDSDSSAALPTVPAACPACCRVPSQPGGGTAADGTSAGRETRHWRPASPTAPAGPQTCCTLCNCGPRQNGGIL